MEGKLSAFHGGVNSKWTYCCYHFEKRSVDACGQNTKPAKNYMRTRIEKRSGPVKAARLNLVRTTWTNDENRYIVLWEYKSTEEM